jgi:hypothetical protein
MPVVPTTAHELLAPMLAENHTLLRELLRRGGGLELLRIAPRVGSEKVPNLNHPDLRSDGLVFEVDDGDQLLSVTVLEPQLVKDDEKRFAWPAYQAGYRHHHRVPVRVVEDELHAGRTRTMGREASRTSSLVARRSSPPS